MAHPGCAPWGTSSSSAANSQLQQNFKTSIGSSKFCICPQREHLPPFLTAQFMQQEQTHGGCCTGLHLLNYLQTGLLPLRCCLARLLHPHSQFAFVLPTDRYILPQTIMRRKPEAWRSCTAQSRAPASQVLSPCPSVTPHCPISVGFSPISKEANFKNYLPVLTAKKPFRITIAIAELAL